MSWSSNPPPSAEATEAFLPVASAGWAIPDFDHWDLFRYPGIAAYYHNFNYWQGSRPGLKNLFCVIRGVDEWLISGLKEKQLNDSYDVRQPKMTKHWISSQMIQRGPLVYDEQLENKFRFVWNIGICYKKAQRQALPVTIWTRWWSNVWMATIYRIDLLRLRARCTCYFCVKPTKPLVRKMRNDVSLTKIYKRYSSTLHRILWNCFSKKCNHSDDRLFCNI